MEKNNKESYTVGVQHKGWKVAFIGTLFLILPLTTMESPLRSLNIMPLTVKRVMETIKPKEVKLVHYDRYFKDAISFIKKHEGFVDTPYVDICGYRTIGYGFITKYVDKKYRERVTKTQAHNIIVKKLRQNIRDVKKTYPKLNYKQALAVAHLAYGKGLGKIKKHKLHQQLKDGRVNRETWLYFSNFERTRNNYRKSREYELSLFKG